jgi:outer membrane protein assembly factor BamB
VQRWLDNGGGGNFVLKLDTTGKLIWVRPVNGPSLNSIAATSDGGVLAAGIASDRGSLVTRFTADGASVWSFSLGGDLARVLSISAAGSTMVIGGTDSGTADFDPGPGIDPIFGDISFVSRFTF